jgi:hypothetical protein
MGNPGQLKRYVFNKYIYIYIYCHLFPYMKIITNVINLHTDTWLKCVGNLHQATVLLTLHKVLFMHEWHCITWTLVQLEVLQSGTSVFQQEMFSLFQGLLLRQVSNVTSSGIYCHLQKNTDCISNMKTVSCEVASCILVALYQRFHLQGRLGSWSRKGRCSYKGRKGCFGGGGLNTTGVQRWAKDCEALKGA